MEKDYYYGRWVQQKDGFIIYSLGNFMSGQKHENSRQSSYIRYSIN